MQKKHTQKPLRGTLRKGWSMLLKIRNPENGLKRTIYSKNQLINRTN